MKADYGLRALLDLAEHVAEGRPTPCHEIASRQDIPAPFLDQLLMSLRRAGLVQSSRGPRGGHALARAPEEITLAAAIEVLEGSPGDSQELGDPTGYVETIRGVLGRAEEAAREVLEGVTLADLVREHARQPVFHGIYKPVVGAER